MKCLIVPVLVVFVAVIAAAQSDPVTKIHSPVTSHSMLVSGEWLNRHLDDPDLVILHVGSQRGDYDKGHISGARFVPISEIMTARDGVQNELPPVAALKQTFERAGVSDNSHVVLYGDVAGLFAARAYFTLDYLGHADRTSVLDGGFDKWRADRRPLSSETPEVKPGTFTPHVRPEVVMTLTAVRDISWEIRNDPRSRLALVDARPADEFKGNPVEGLSRFGHIPGAVNVYWRDMVVGKENPELLPIAQLRTIFADARITSGKKVIVYCRTGVQAAFVYFVAQYLGYDAILFDGSFAEWAKAPDTEVAVGPN